MLTSETRRTPSRGERQETRIIRIDGFLGVIITGLENKPQASATQISRLVDAILTPLVQVKSQDVVIVADESGRTHVPVGSVLGRTPPGTSRCRRQTFSARDAPIVPVSVIIVVCLYNGLPVEDADGGCPCIRVAVGSPREECLSPIGGFEMDVEDFTPG